MSGEVAGMSDGPAVDPKAEEEAKANVQIVKVKKTVDPTGGTNGSTRKDSQDYQFTGVNPGSKGWKQR